MTHFTILPLLFVFDNVIFPSQMFENLKNSITTTLYVLNLITVQFEDWNVVIHNFQFVLQYLQVMLTFIFQLYHYLFPNCHGLKKSFGKKFHLLILTQSHLKINQSKQITLETYGFIQNINIQWVTEIWLTILTNLLKKETTTNFSTLLLALWSLLMQCGFYTEW